MHSHDRKRLELQIERLLSRFDARPDSFASSLYLNCDIKGRGSIDFKKVQEYLQELVAQTNLEYTIESTLAKNAQRNEARMVSHIHLATTHKAPGRVPRVPLQPVPVRTATVRTAPAPRLQPAPLRLPALCMYYFLYAVL